MTKLSISRCLGLLLPLLIAAGAASALTMGRQQGSAVMGRPLEMQVPVGLDPGMDAADLCPEAEVVYGDSRVSPRMLDVQVSPAASGAGGGQAVMLRIRSAQPLDEPFASVLLRVGCTQKLSRRFVLLAEQPAGDVPMPLAASALPLVGESAQPSPVPREPGPAAVPLPPGSGGSVGTAAPPPASARAPSNSQLPSAAQAQAQSRPSPNAAPPAPRALAQPQPRLRLDPLEVRPQGGAASPGSAPSAPVPALAGSGASPASAGDAGATGPDAARQQAMAVEIRNLQEALHRSQGLSAELRARLVQVEQERFANPLVFGLIAVVALALALAAIAWRRASARTSAAWWEETGSSPSGAAISPTFAGGAAPGAASGLAPSPDPLRPSTLIATGRAPGVGSGPAVALPDNRQPEPLSLSTNELSDIQQEADFFVSLGEYDRAIEVLRNHIEIHPQASALAWLDLLEIQHKLGRQEEYEQLRHDFEWLFNARVPAFEDFNRDQNGLEDHPDLLVRIQDLWPGPEVLEVIDAGIFRAPADNKDRPLSLQAYRDLLFLHQLSREIALSGASRSGAESANAPAAWSPAQTLAGQGVGVAGPLAAAAHALLAPAPGSARARALDINLDEVLAQPASAPDPLQAPDSESAFAQGLDELLNFDLDFGDSDRSIRKSGGNGRG